MLRFHVGIPTILQFNGFARWQNSQLARCSCSIKMASLLANFLVTKPNFLPIYFGLVFLGKDQGLFLNTVFHITK